MADDGDPESDDNMTLTAYDRNSGAQVGVVELPISAGNDIEIITTTRMPSRHQSRCQLASFPERLVERCRKAYVGGPL